LGIDQGYFRCSFFHKLFQMPAMLLQLCLRLAPVGDVVDIHHKSFDDPILQEVHADAFQNAG